MTRQMFVGGGGRNRRAELLDSIEAAAAPVLNTADDVVFVAVDMLMFDDETLLDVPLLERKRLLESVLVEGRLVRRSIHVRLPIDVWLRTWRNLGFQWVAYKEANSRYMPGAANEDWVRAAIPRG
jgi:ATP-dependent DNA ligase